MKIALLNIVWLLAACTSQDKTKRVEIVPNPMATLWNKVGDKVELLGSRNASRSEWKSESESEEPITNQRQLRECIERSRLETHAKTEAFEIFRTSEFVAHYGFDADYHALVFFDKSRHSIRAFKW